MDERIMYKRSRVLREYVTCIHLTTMFIGLGLCSLGAYLVNSSMSRTVSIILLILGVFTATTALIGCFGAHIENTGFLNTFSSVTAITFILELVALGVAYSHELQVDHYSSMLYDFFVNNDSKFILDIERAFKCCGYASIGDRPIPKTCSILLGVEIGCRESIITTIRNKHQWITLFILVLLCLQFIALLISVILSFIMDRETREEETYMALLHTNNNQQQYSWLNHHSNSFHSDHSSYFHRSSQRSIPKYGSTPSN